LKDLFFKKNGAAFILENYPKLRKPQAWADLKFLSLDREKLAAGMRKHTTQPIHAPLTEIISKEQAKIAETMFKNIMGFMGDRQYPSPVLLAQEVLQTCLNNSWLRDEIYCQLIKQVTSNSNSYALSSFLIPLVSFPCCVLRYSCHFQLI